MGRSQPNIARSSALHFWERSAQPRPIREKQRREPGKDTLISAEHRTKISVANMNPSPETRAKMRRRAAASEGRGMDTLTRVSCKDQRRTQ